MAFLKRLRVRLARRAKTMQTSRELYALNDKELADIGINRCDIPRIARECA